MTIFRKGDVVAIEGTIDSSFVYEGKTKVRIEPHSEIYANLTDLKMVRSVIEVGDRVTYPAEGYKAGEVLAIIDGYCWVKIAPTKHPYAPLGAGMDDGLRVSWPLASLNRVDPEPDVEAAPLAESAA